MAVLYGDAETSWLTWPVGRAQDGRQAPSGKKVILRLIEFEVEIAMCVCVGGGGVNPLHD